MTLTTDQIGQMAERATLFASITSIVAQVVEQRIVDRDLTPREVDAFVNDDMLAAMERLIALGHAENVRRLRRVLGAELGADFVLVVGDPAAFPCAGQPEMAEGTVNHVHLTDPSGRIAELLRAALGGADTDSPSPRN